MIKTKSLNPRDKEAERNLKPTKESKIEKIKLFDESNPRSIRIDKNLPDDFKQKLVELSKKYHECFT